MTAILLGELGKACGADNVRTAGDADRVAGAPARLVAAPGDPASLAAVVAVAGSHGLRIAARGGGSKIDWGRPPSGVDVIVDVGRLRGYVRPEPAQEEIRLGAGVRVEDVERDLASVGLRLGLDPPSPGATLGGVLGTDEAGPLALASGATTELIRSAEVVRGDGTVGEVAGDELARLGGSFGTLGIVTAATFGLRPAPAARAWVSRTISSPLELHELVMLLATTPLGVVAIEADLPAVRLPRQRDPERTPSASQSAHAGHASVGVLIEGTPAGVASRASMAVTLLGGNAAGRDTPPRWWGRYPFGPGDVALRISMPSGEIHAAVYSIHDAVGAAAAIRGSVGRHVIHAGLPLNLPPELVVGAVTAVRQTLLARGGSCLVLRAPAELRQAIDAQAPLPGEDQARSLKRQLDPEDRLVPGRLPHVA